MSKYDSNTLKQLRNRIRNTEGPLKLVLGAGDVWYGHDWIATNEEDLDILDSKSWEFFLGPRLCDNMCAEHVWEHFTPMQARLGICNVFNFLKFSGRFRIAVPDGN